MLSMKPLRRNPSINHTFKAIHKIKQRLVVTNHPKMVTQLNSKKIKLRATINQAGFTIVLGLREVKVAINQEMFSPSYWSNLPYLTNSIIQLTSFPIGKTTF